MDLLFYIFSALTLLCGLLVAFNPFSRNPVTSAMFLVLTIISMSGLFVLLQAYFLAAVQILVYAGAVIVLFLFVIMLIDVKEEERRRFQKFGTFLGVTAVAGLGAIIINTIGQTQLPTVERAHGEIVQVSMNSFSLKNKEGVKRFAIPTPKPNNGHELPDSLVMTNGMPISLDDISTNQQVTLSFTISDDGLKTVKNIRLGRGLGETSGLGGMLFSNYVLPFEIISVLLLVAMGGCILLSKRDEPKEADAE